MTTAPHSHSGGARPTPVSCPRLFLGGKTFHGRIIKPGNKWLRWAFVEAVAPAVFCDLEVRTYYQRLKVTKGANRAKVATARRLFTIAFVLLRDARSYEGRGATPTSEANLSRLS